MRIHNRILGFQVRSDFKRSVREMVDAQMSPRVSYLVDISIWESVYSQLILVKQNVRNELGT